MDVIHLSTAPMPYITEFNLKKFNANEYHCTRSVPFFVLIFMLKNTLIFEEDGVEIYLKKGEWYIQLKDLTQTSHKPSSKAEYYYIHFFGEYTTDRINSINLPRKGTFSNNAFIPLLKSLHKLVQRFPKNFIEIQRLFLKIIDSLQIQHPPQNSIATQIMEFLHDNYYKKITSSTLAAKFNFSPKYIEKKMKSEYGITPHQYLTQIRLQNAKMQLERSNISITNIAQNCGFGDSSVLYKAFRKFYGISPSQWRKKHRINVIE